MVTEEEMERALRWLARTDVLLAKKRVAVLRTEHMATVAESLSYKVLEGTVEDRKRACKVTEEVQAAVEKQFAAVLEYETLRAQRKSAELLIEVWRSTEASRRVGNI